jgi:hypothetical protein
MNDKVYGTVTRQLANMEVMRLAHLKTLRQDAALSQDDLAR